MKWRQRKRCGCQYEVIRLCNVFRRNLPFLEQINKFPPQQSGPFDSSHHLKRKSTKSTHPQIHRAKMDHRVKTFERNWRWTGERFENPELESLFQRYSAKVQNRSSYLIFAIGNAILALLFFRFSVETLAMTCTFVTLLGLWIFQQLYGKEWILTIAFLVFSTLFVVIGVPAPIPHRLGKHRYMQD